MCLLDGERWVMWRVTYDTTEDAGVEEVVLGRDEAHALERIHEREALCCGGAVLEDSFRAERRDEVTP